MIVLPELAVEAVVCNYNQASWLPTSLERLLAQTARLRRIHVVDNASTDNSLAVMEALAGKSPVPFIIHRLEKNTGGAGGFSYGTAAAMRYRPDYILLIDGDAFLHECAIELLLQHAISKRDVAVLGTKIYFAPKEAGDWNHISSGRTIQEIGGKLDWDNAEFTLCHRGYNEESRLPLSGSFEVDYVAACACLVRAEAVERCGTMDPSFFIYWDDIDWCTRMRATGYRIEAVADAQSWHVGGGRVRTSLLPTYYHWRNKIRFFGTYGIMKPESRALGSALFQGLRAAFTCRHFGQSAAADILELALEHGWTDYRGILDCPAEKLRMEPVQRRVEPKRESDGYKWIEGLMHVLDVSDGISSLDPDRTVLADRFGKEMRLSDALAARQAFLKWYPDRLKELQRLPAAWK